ncbi:helix-turn-helix domain-containing protein [Streptomyces sp. NPDC088354]|uniref:helix-turn-helix domain-containing protein n=1 Tax=unclassified Streptomyces TaxID=2593676 RepID=UPI0029B82852|nr:helix-turn-helix transcriptional regulator [Streptomyces sp. MI02-7b]MDX3071161.1 helix-turn-helix transcriptional regulator [Streptomyces sp. MI02-7b]
MDGTNALGEFLRARRGLVSPEEAGITPGGLRRVQGLRREEVALLAGISADYYLRLEQGRDRNPSAQVLASIARVLRLDDDATAHLLALARTGAAGRARVRTAARKPRLEQMPHSIRQLIDGWPANPAWVQNRFFDVLGANALGAALSPNNTRGVNLLRAAFLDPAERARRRDWEAVTREGVATLRAQAGPGAEDPRLNDLVGELSLRSERFRQLWGRHDVRPQKGHVTRLTHPLVGDLDLMADKLSVGGTDGFVLVVLHAEPGSRDEELLRLLGSLAVSGSGARPVGQRSAEHPPAGHDRPGTDES